MRKYAKKHNILLNVDFKIAYNIIGNSSRVFSMIIKRDIYLNKLIDSMNNGLIKVVTGIRRCGKSFLLFSLFNYI